ncbi:MAG: hypothetical protein WCC64_03350 [Aliidongia sp.]
MSVVQPPSRPNVQLSNGAPTDLVKAAEHRRQLAEGVNRVNQGHLNACLFVTLAANEPTTTVVDSRISKQTCASFMPQTADAAAEIAGGAMYVACTNGLLTISHANNAKADRTFTMSMIG